MCWFFSSFFFKNLAFEREKKIFAIFISWQKVAKQIYLPPVLSRWWLMKSFLNVSFFAIKLEGGTIILLFWISAKKVFLSSSEQIWLSPIFLGQHYVDSTNRNNWMSRRFNRRVCTLGFRRRVWDQRFQTQRLTRRDVFVNIFGFLAETRDSVFFLWWGKSVLLFFCCLQMRRVFHFLLLKQCTNQEEGLLLFRFFFFSFKITLNHCSFLCWFFSSFFFKNLAFEREKKIFAIFISWQKVAKQIYLPPVLSRWWLMKSFLNVSFFAIKLEGGTIILLFWISAKKVFLSSSEQIWLSPIFLGQHYVDSTNRNNWMSRRFNRRVCTLGFRRRVWDQRFQTQRLTRRDVFVNIFGFLAETRDSVFFLWWGKSVLLFFCCLQMRRVFHFLLLKQCTNQEEGLLLFRFFFFLFKITLNHCSFLCWFFSSFFFKNLAFEREKKIFAIFISWQKVAKQIYLPPVLSRWWLMKSFLNVSFFAIKLEGGTIILLFWISAKKVFLSSSEQIWLSPIFLGQHYVDSTNRNNWMSRRFNRRVCTLGFRRRVWDQRFQTQRLTRRDVFVNIFGFLAETRDSVFFLWWGKSVLLFFCCLQMRRVFHFLLLKQCTNQEEGLLLFRFFFFSFKITLNHCSFLCWFFSSFFFKNLAFEREKKIFAIFISWQKVAKQIYLPPVLSRWWLMKSFLNVSFFAIKLEGGTIILLFWISAKKVFLSSSEQIWLSPIFLGQHYVDSTNRNNWMSRRFNRRVCTLGFRRRVWDQRFQTQRLTRRDVFVNIFGFLAETRDSVFFLWWGKSVLLFFCCLQMRRVFHFLLLKQCTNQEEGLLLFRFFFFSFKITLNHCSFLCWFFSSFFFKNLAFEREKKIFAIFISWQKVAKQIYLPPVLSRWWLMKSFLNVSFFAIKLEGGTIILLFWISAKKVFLSSSEQIWLSPIFLGQHYVDSTNRNNWMSRRFNRRVCTLGFRRRVWDQRFQTQRLTRRDVFVNIFGFLAETRDSVFFLWWGKSVLLFFCCLQMRRVFHFLLLKQCTNQEEGLLLFRFFFFSFKITLNHCSFLCWFFSSFFFKNLAFEREKKIFAIFISWQKVAKQIYLPPVLSRWWLMKSFLNVSFFAIKLEGGTIILLFWISAKKVFLSSSEQIWLSPIFLGQHYVDSTNRNNWMSRRFNRRVCTLGFRRRVWDQRFQTQRLTRRDVFVNIFGFLAETRDSVFFLWWGKSVLLFFCCLQMRRVFHFLLLKQCTNQEEGLLLFRFFFFSFKITLNHCSFLCWFFSSFFFKNLAFEREKKIFAIFISWQKVAKQIYLPPVLSRWWLMKSFLNVSFFAIKLEGGTIILLFWISAKKVFLSSSEQIWLSPIFLGQHYVDSTNRNNWMSRRFNRRVCTLGFRRRVWDQRFQTQRLTRRDVFVNIFGFLAETRDSVFFLWWGKSVLLFFCCLQMRRVFHFLLLKQCTNQEEGLLLFRFFFFFVQDYFKSLFIFVLIFFFVFF